MSTAQKLLVERLLSWDLVEARLARYPAISASFPLELLRRRCVAEPYFCHYIAWRLGTWRSEELLGRLEELVALGASLPNWGAERALRESAEFADFWSLVWQLQVAEHLVSCGWSPEWSSSGPDLKARRGSVLLYVECYQYRKSFALEGFVEELIDGLGDDLCIERDLCVPFKLPSDRERTDFLDRTLAPLLDSKVLESARGRAAERYPVLLSDPASPIRLYVEGSNADNYDPSILRSTTGDPRDFLAVALGEVARAKQGRNSLGSHRPNLVVASLLLGADVQVALHSVQTLGQELPAPVLPADIDALAFSVTGIDQKLSKDQLRLVVAPPPGHPASELASLG